MENLIIILSMLLNIALIIALAVYVKRFNDEKKLNEFNKTSYEDKNDILIKENILLKHEIKVNNEKMYEHNIEIERQRIRIEELKQISALVNDKLFELDERQKQIAKLIQKCDRQNAEIESLQSINNTLLNDNRKLADELQEIKNKPFDPLKELDSLTIRKDETKTPEAKPKPKTKNGLKINYPDKNDFRNNV